MKYILLTLILLVAGCKSENDPSDNKEEATLEIVKEEVSPSVSPSEPVKVLEPVDEKASSFEEVLDSVDKKASPVEEIVESMDDEVSDTEEMAESAYDEVYTSEEIVESMDEKVSSTEDALDSVVDEVSDALDAVVDEAEDVVEAIDDEMEEPAYDELFTSEKVAEPVDEEVSPYEETSKPEMAMEKMETTDADMKSNEDSGMSFKDLAQNSYVQFFALLMIVAGLYLAFFYKKRN